MEEVARETTSRLNYESILMHRIEDCCRARNAGNLAAYSEAVMTFYDTLSQRLIEKVKPAYDEIQKAVEDGVKKLHEELQTLSNPIDRANYYQARIAAIERENTDKLYKKILLALDEEGMLAKQRFVKVGRE